MKASHFPVEITVPCGYAGINFSCSNHQCRQRQGGIVLVIGLIVLVAMTLAGIALVRSIATNNMIAGNLGFKQGATSTGDAGIEAGISWLKTVAGTTAVYLDLPASGYYATSQPTLDMTGSSHDPTRALVNWDFNNCNNLAPSTCFDPAAAINAGAGNSVSYIIHRLCQSTGDPNSTANTCATYQSTTSTSPKKSELKYGENKRFEPLPVVYYRITSRVKGPRNTISFVETIIHF